MKRKKSKKADLESKRGIFFQVGLIIALFTTLFAFNYGTKSLPYNDSKFIDKSEDVTEILIPVTRRPEQKQEQTQVLENLKPVDEIEEITREPEPEPDLLPEGDITEIPETPIVPDLGVPDEGYDPNEVILFPQQMPEFPGGKDALMQFLGKNTKYPNRPLNNNIQGTVFVQFVVNRFGKVEQIVILRGVHPDLDKEAARVIGSMPEWKPGMQNGRKVNVRYTVPIVFKLQNSW